MKTPAPAGLTVDQIWEVKEAYRFFVDASHHDLEDAQMSRSQALAKARELEAKLKTPFTLALDQLELLRHRFRLMLETSSVEETAKLINMALLLTQPPEAGYIFSVMLVRPQDAEQWGDCMNAKTPIPQPLNASHC